MISFDPSELVHWADKPNCSSHLPELMRRLVLATIPRASLVDIPGGSSVTQSGWDGLLVVAEGNPWVPSGASAWEVTCQGGITTKATGDYSKRTKDPGSVDPKQATFVFVTPRRWNSKGQWTEARREEGEWADVRVLDADDLVQWLQQAPAVADWLARLTGKLPASGVVSLDAWWQGWAWRTNPRTSPELTMAGRHEQAEQVGAWLAGEAGQFYIQAETRDETIAFFAASAIAAWDQWGSTVFSRTLVVENADAWRSLEHHPVPLVLVRHFGGGQIAPAVAVAAGHHVLLPLNESDEPRGSGCELPRLGREETVAALINMGLGEEKARSLIRITARHMSVLRRQLLEDAGESPPGWTSSGSAHLLATAALVGQWNEDSTGDRDVVARVTGHSYEEVARELAAQAAQPDSPVVKVGSRWRFTSHEEAWHLSAPLLTNEDLTRFQGVATEVLRMVWPGFELPREERFMASVKGKSLPHSNIIRSGIARSLALMASRPERARNADRAADLPSRVVDDLLGKDSDWRVWATLDRDLPILAEAAPQALLDSIEQALEQEPSPFRELFDQEGDGLFGGIYHAGLLWALETLAWSQDHFSQVALILARLAQMDPGGRSSNRPVESLQSLFLPWIRFSEVTDEHRLATIDMLIEALPNQAWKLLVGVWPTGHGIVQLRTPPTWRPWGQDAARTPTQAEAGQFLDGLLERLLKHVGTDARRWTDIVGLLPDIPEPSAKDAVDRLAGLADQLKDQPDASGLWAKIRATLHHHRSFPEAGWAMPTDKLDALESIYHRLTPDDPVAANAWLFSAWPGLPDGEKTSGDYGEEIFRTQQAAVRAVFENYGAEHIAGIARVAEIPFRVGWAVALGFDNDAAALDLALPYLGGADGKLREFSRGVCAGLFSKAGWPLLEEAIRNVKAATPTSEAVADIYLTAPADRETWRRLDEEGPHARKAYWSLLAWFSIRGEESEDLSFAIERLLEVDRSVAAAERLSHVREPLPSEVIVRVLEQLPYDVAREVAAGIQPNIHGYHLARLFEKLDQAQDVTEETIARLEIPYVGVLEHDRPNLALHRQILKNPAAFADLIAWTFRRSDGQVDHEMGDEAERRNRARVAYDILFRLRGLPGLKEDGTVDGATLRAWIEEARRLCQERGRERIGDDRIGSILANAPVGSDGVWPCEEVRDVIDRYRSVPMGRGFAVGKINLRGTTSRGAFEGGGSERSLAEKFRRDAAKVSMRWPFTARWLRSIADSHEHEGRWHDEHAEWLDRFES